MSLACQVQDDAWLAMEMLTHAYHLSNGHEDLDDLEVDICVQKCLLLVVSFGFIAFFLTLNCVNCRWNYCNFIKIVVFLVYGSTYNYTSSSSSKFLPFKIPVATFHMHGWQIEHYTLLLLFLKSFNLVLRIERHLPSSVSDHGLNAKFI